MIELEIFGLEPGWRTFFNEGQILFTIFLLLHRGSDLLDGDWMNYFLDPIHIRSGLVKKLVWVTRGS